MLVASCFVVPPPKKLFGDDNHDECRRRVDLKRI